VFAFRVSYGERGRDEAEKPFWISYADLMTALMVLFLVVMSVALLAVTKSVSEAEQRKLDRDQAIKYLLDQLELAVARFPGMSVDRVQQAVEFGDRARFPFRQASLTAGQQRALREFIPEVLRLAETNQGERWLKRVLVVGFTDPRGTYLANLDLSLERSQSALCALFATPLLDERPLTENQKRHIQELFLVGGFAFNALRATDDESRRVELRLEFYGLDESPTGPTLIALETNGSCNGLISR
jgi:outer membrane protein OmpA-like peptidoglycan-associated protein